MTSRAIVTSFAVPAVINNGAGFSLGVNALYTDPAIPGSGRVMQAEADLDASTPATWTPTIKAAVALIGVQNGFPDLVVANVFAPTYG